MSDGKIAFPKKFGKSVLRKQTKLLGREIIISNKPHNAETWKMGSLSFLKIWFLGKIWNKLKGDPSKALKNFWKKDTQSLKFSKRVPFSLVRFWICTKIVLAEAGTREHDHCVLFTNWYRLQLSKEPLAHLGNLSIGWCLKKSPL